MRTLLVALLVLVAFYIGAMWIRTSFSSRPVKGMERFALSTEDLTIPEGTDIIALGEATHGNREFQELKLSVLRTLVEKDSVRAFCLEADFGDGLMVDRFVKGEGDDARKAVSNLSFNIYKTPEMVRLVEWIRSWNDSAPEKDRISFYGFDMQNPGNSVGYICDHMDDSSVREALSPLMADEIHLEDGDVKAAIAYLGRLSSQDEICSHAIRNVLSCFEFYRWGAGRMPGAVNTARDSIMAGNVEWISRYEKSLGHPRILVCGHNGHIARKGWMYRNMGHNLSSRGYYCIGTDYWKASVNIGSAHGRRNHTVHSADPLASYAAKCEGGQYLLQFSNVEEGSPAWKAITSPISMGSVGEGWYALMKIMPRSTRIKDRPASLYDAMILVHTAHPTSPDPEMGK